MDKDSGYSEDKRETEGIQELEVEKDWSTTVSSGNARTTASMNSQQFRLLTSDLYKIKTVNISAWSI